MILIAIYTVVVSIGEFGAYLLGRLLEATYPNIAMPVFMTLFFVVLWLGWEVSVLLVRPWDTAES